MKLKIFISLLINWCSVGLSQTSNQIIADPWIINTRFGFVFETPGNMTESPIDVSHYDDVIKASYFSYSKGDFGIINIIMDTKFKSFDPQSSLYGAVNNMVKNLKGSNITLSYTKKFQNGINMECTGTFTRNGNKYLIEGFSYFTSQKRAFTIISVGPNNIETTSKIERLFKSIQVSVK